MNKRISHWWEKLLLKSHEVNLEPKQPKVRVSCGNGQAQEAIDGQE